MASAHPLVQLWSRVCSTLIHDEVCMVVETNGLLFPLATLLWLSLNGRSFVE